MRRFSFPVRMLHFATFCCCLGAPNAALAFADGPRLLKAGPMLGHTTEAETVIWLQTTEPAEVRISYHKDGERQASSVASQTTAELYLTAKIRLTGLEPGSAYSYEILLNGEILAFPYRLAFTTQPIWRYRTDPPDIRFAVGSCLYVNDPPFDRPGEPYGGDYQILGHIRGAQPHFMIWTGDNTYLREGDFTPTRMDYRYRHTRALAELQPLLAGTVHYATWDDHDFGPNNSNRNYPFKGEALRLFNAYWTNPHAGTDEVRGVFCKWSWSDVDFFLLDDRYHRAPNESADPDKPFFGAGQLAWLKDALVSSDASFKLVVSGNQVLNRYSPHEGFANYRREYRELMDWLDASKVAGVVFISGDRHFTELLKERRAGNYGLYEFTCSPLTSGTIGRLGDEADNPLRVPGTLLSENRNFALLTVKGTPGERELHIQVIDANGAPRWEYTIPRKELEPPN